MLRLLLISLCSVSLFGQSASLELSFTGCTAALTGGLFDSATVSAYATVTGITNTANNKTSPLCTTTAAAFTEDTANSQHQASTSQSLTVSAAAHTYTLYAKEITGNRDVGMVIADNVFAGQCTAQFNLATGVISVAAAALSPWTTPSAKIVALNNGWFALSITCTTTSYTASSFNFYIQMALNNGGSGTYTGNSSIAAFWGVDYR